MKKTSSFIAGTFILIAVALGWSAFVRQAGPVDQSASLAGDEVRIDALAAEVAALREELRGVKLEARTVKAPTSLAPNLSDGTPAPKARRPEPDFAARAALAEEREQDRIHQLDLFIASETRDVAWAGEMEAFVRETAAEIEGAEVLALECQATICRAEVRYQDFESSDRMSDALSASTKVGRTMVKPTSAEGEPPSSLIYFRRALETRGT